MWLFLAFLGIPMIEIALFISVGGAIGLWPTLAIVLLTAIAGTVLMRREGRAAMARLRGALETGEDPSGPIAHGAAILVAGVLLLTPGFFTDAVGLALMLPPVRALLFRAIGPWLAERMRLRRGPHGPGFGPGAGPSPGRPAGDQIIEGEFEEVGEQPPRDDSPWRRPQG